MVAAITPVKQVMRPKPKRLACCFAAYLELKINPAERRTPPGKECFLRIFTLLITFVLKM